MNHRLGRETRGRGRQLRRRGARARMPAAASFKSFTNASPEACIDCCIIGPICTKRSISSGGGGATRTSMRVPPLGPSLSAWVSVRFTPVSNN